MKLMGLSNLLACVSYIEKLTQNLPEGTNDLKMLTLIKNSIGNNLDLKEISEITSIKVLMNYINTKYQGSPTLLNDFLKPIREAKDPWSKKISISNIHICLNLYSRLKSVKLFQVRDSAFGFV